MQFEEFIRQVQERSGMETREESLAITRAVLETLGERVDRRVRNGLEAQLPNELKAFLLAREENPDEYDLAEFYNRVAARADLNYQDATEQTRQVFAVLQQAIAGGEHQDLLQSLPDEYAELFKQEPPNQAQV